MADETMIRVKKNTLRQLNELKAPGQSLDGLLQQLIDVVNDFRPATPWEGPPLPYGVLKQLKQPFKGRRNE